MTHRFFTIAFEGDIGSFEGNPLKTITPFGVPHTVARGNAFDERDRLEEQRDALVKALQELVSARALAGVRGIVAGWNGEGKPDGPYQRHPRGLGATLPKTNCGAVYELDEAMQRARATLAALASAKEGE